MWAWLRRHWLVLAGVVPLIPAAIKGALALINIGGNIDFVVSRSQDPGWVGQMIDWIIDPSGWAILPLIALGFACIYWDFRRKLPRASTAGSAEDKRPYLPTLPHARPAQLPTNYRRRSGKVTFDYSTYNGAVSVGAGEREFILVFSGGGSISIRLYTRRYKSVSNVEKLARVKDAAKNDRLEFRDYDSSSDYYLIGINERFLAENINGFFIQGKVISVKAEGRN
jgi:hypothetical protein